MHRVRFWPWLPEWVPVPVLAGDRGTTGARAVGGSLLVGASTLMLIREGLFGGAFRLVTPSRTTARSLIGPHNWPSPLSKGLRHPYCVPNRPEAGGLFFCFGALAEKGFWVVGPGKGSRHARWWLLTRAEVRQQGRLGTWRYSAYDYCTRARSPRGESAGDCPFGGRPPLVSARMIKPIANILLFFRG